MKKLLFPLSVAVVALVFALAGEALTRGLVAPASPTVAGSVTLSPLPGLWREGVTLSLRPSEPSHTIVYAMDGSAPSAQVGTLYTKPIRLSADTPGMRVIRAVEVMAGLGGDAVAGPVISASYGVGLSPSLPVISLIAEPADLWGAESGVLANPSFRGTDWERPVHVSGFFADSAAFALPAGLRVDGRELYSAAKQTLRLYFRSEYGPARLQAALFPDHPHQAIDAQSYKRLLLQAGEHGVTWSLLSDQAVTILARELGLPAAQGRFVWLFINGSSWGLYRLTERVDRFMVAADFGVASADVVQEGDARDGTDEDWNALVDSATSDLSDAATYAEFVSQVDLANFIDSAVLWQVFGFPADALVAVQPQGGRWFWVFEGGAPQEISRGSDFGVLYAALMGNPSFRDAFASRLADLRNSALAPASVSRALAVASADLAPDFVYERGRWPGVPTLEDEVAALEVTIRDRVTALTTGLGVDVPLRLSPVPEATGRLYVNGQLIRAADGDWSGWYAPGTRVDVIVVPTTGSVAVGWEVTGLGMVASDSRAALTMSEPMTLTALLAPASAAHEERKPQPDDVLINELWINDDGTQYGSLGRLPLEGDWVELLVRAPRGVDLRGWRLTDNDTRDGDAEGSFIFPWVDALANVPCGTVILIVATATPANASAFQADDLNAWDGKMLFYIGNGVLDAWTDPGFAIGTGNEAIALLAPGATDDLGDDVGIDFAAEGREVTPWTFGVLADGVTFDTPFRRLGADDGAVFTATGGNDVLDDWIVDPPACASEDAQCYGVRTVVTPGALNPGQSGYRLRCLVQRLARK